MLFVFTLLHDRPESLPTVRNLWHKNPSSLSDPTPPPHARFWLSALFSRLHSPFAASDEGRELERQDPGHSASPYVHSRFSGTQTNAVFRGHQVLLGISIRGVTMGRTSRFNSESHSPCLQQGSRIGCMLLRVFQMWEASPVTDDPYAQILRYAGDPPNLCPLGVQIVANFLSPR